MASKTYFCEKCHKELSEKQFYTSNNLEKYPNDGKLNLCKKCLTMHVNNWDPNTFLWILREVDVPFMPNIWDSIMEQYGRDPKKLTGMTILGRYFSTMRISQYKDFRWKDNAFIQEQNASKLRRAMQENGYGAAEIADAIEKAKYTLPEDDELGPPPPPEEPEFCGKVTIPSFVTEPDPPPPEDYFGAQSSLTAEELGLTEEDVTYLRMKWGKQYRPEEWVQLEQLYEEMMGSYDIQTAGHKDTLKLICKTSLKANQLVDVGDIDGYQKMSKVYDSLMRSGNFTAAQNKGENGEFIDSLSELIALCEQDGFIPRYYTDGPQDKIDRVIQDMQEYTRTLVVEEMHLGGLIERAIKALENEKEQEDKEEEDIDEEKEFEDSLFDSPTIEPLSAEDLLEFNDFQERMGELDSYKRRGK